MTDLNVIDELKQTLTFNLFVSNEDGRIAWTVNPMSLDDLYIDQFTGCPFYPRLR